jgi:hypothetical protein
MSMQMPGATTKKRKTRWTNVEPKGRRKNKTQFSVKPTWSHNGSGQAQT